MSRDEAFSAFVRERQAHLLRIAHALTGQRSSAEDLLQTALVKLYVAWPRLRRPEAAEAYARTTMVRAHIDETRRPWRREVPSEALPDRADSAADTAAGAGDETLLAALGALTPMQRSVVVLRHWLDLSVEQTARELGISTGAVKTHSHRAIAALRRSPSVVELAGRGSRPAGGSPSAGAGGRT